MGVAYTGKLVSFRNAASSLRTPWADDTCIDKNDNVTFSPFDALMDLVDDE